MVAIPDLAAEGDHKGSKWGSIVDKTVVEHVGGVAEAFQTADGWCSGKTCSDEPRSTHSAKT